LTDTTGTAATQFVGRKAGIFAIALRTGILTVLTFGLYRFWMKTRLRQYYWSAIRPGGLPLEYMGQPIEKLLGFLIAVVFLAFYIGIVNLILVFGSFAIFHGNLVAYVVSFVGLVPLWFFAQYRARRYVLARTRWRGIRFGIEPGAWGYSLCACLLWLLTILSLGLLWPVKTFWLEKYRTDRTFFGQVRLHQGGRWTMLIRPFLWVAMPWLVVLALVGHALWSLFALSRDLGPGADHWAGNWDSMGELGLSLITSGLIGIVALALMVIGALHYSVAAFRRLAAHKRAGPLRLTSHLRTGRLARIYGFGYLFTYFCVGIAVVLLGVALGLVAFYGAGAPEGGLDFLLFGAQADSALARALFIGLSIASYFAIFIIWSVFLHVFVTLPRLRHYAETLEVHGMDHLGGVLQRERDEFAEAEGFAEALDLGAAI